VFRARIDGKLQPLTKQRLTPDQTKNIAESLITSEAVKEDLDRIKDYDCTWGAAGVGRFRVNILKQRSSYMIVLRVIPFEIQSLEKLRLPEAVAELAERDQGLLLVSGLGPSTTSDVMAAIIHHVNLTSGRHVVTLESPIEFLHRDINSSITQREIGTDTDDFATGMKAALRQDPDVIMVGRSLDHATVEPALEAAESGLLVVARVNAPDVAGSIAKIKSLFPPAEGDLTRVRLADAIVGAIGIRKLSRADSPGRATVAEVFVGTPDSREFLTEPQGLDRVHEFIEQNAASLGTRTFEQHAAELVEEGAITEAAASVFSQTS
jgi:twitching motility protein PilT